MTNVGVVGLGYWGPNLARNFDRLPDAELTWLCDASEEARERWGRTFPSARTTARLEDLLADDSLDAVVVATPVPTHAELAIQVLLVFWARDYGNQGLALSDVHEEVYRRLRAAGIEIPQPIARTVAAAEGKKA